MKDKNQRVAAIILAGGESRRFGNPKAFATYKGQAFINYAINSVENNTKDIVIISHETLLGRLKGITTYPVIEDLKDFKGNGPLAGMVTGMDYLKADWYIVLPCDSPLITEEVIKRILAFGVEGIDAVIPLVDGKFQPLIAIYHARILEKAKQLLEQKDYKMMSLLEKINVKYITDDDLQVPSTLFQNINNHDEYRKLTE